MNHTEVDSGNGSRGAVRARSGFALSIGAFRREINSNKKKKRVRHRAGFATL